MLCQDPQEGVYDQKSFCYLKLASPQPPAGDASWEGHQPGDGAVYDVRCYAAPYAGSKTALKLMGHRWLATPPTPPGGGVTPGQLAQQAIQQLDMRAPMIGMAPEPGGSGLVGLPVWLWTDQPAQTWDKHSKTAVVPGLSVTATATATSITWDMGDGHHFSCPTAGTPYTPSHGGSASPDCGYTYTQPSGGQPNSEYTITATTTWEITWVASTGETGTVPPMKLTSTTTVKIGELQAVNH